MSLIRIAALAFLAGVCHGASPITTTLPTPTAPPLTLCTSVTLYKYDMAGCVTAPLVGAHACVNI